MKYSIKTEIVPVALVIAGWILGFYFYAHFPDRVVTHWDFQGQPNGYSGKSVAAFLIPGMLSGFYLLFLALPLLDPKKERYESFAGVYHLMKGLILTLLFSIYVLASLANLNYGIRLNYVIPILIGLFFIILGNYMGKLKQNWFMGVRLPWTLSSENVWNKTNRFGGFCMMISGLLFMGTPFLSPTLGFVVFMGSVFLMTFGTAMYSYVIYRKEQQSLKSSQPNIDRGSGRI